MARELVSVCIQNEDLTDKLSYHEELEQKYTVSFDTMVSVIGIVCIASVRLSM